jgi:hypothetical protein
MRAAVSSAAAAVTCLNRKRQHSSFLPRRRRQKARNGQIVLAGAEACARDLGKKRQWDKWARGCSELEFVQIAKVGLELGKIHCDRYSQ